MTSINRLALACVGAAVVGFVTTGTPVSAQTREARGSVMAVTESTMTIKSGAQEITVHVDSGTRLEVRRAARDIQKAQPGGPSPRVNDFFEVGTPVLVRYREENGRNRALDIERVGSAAASAPSSKIADGKVKSVTQSRLTIESDGREFSFAVSSDTDVLARGASKATKAAGGSTPITTFVHAGDMVSVTYRENAGEMTAAEVRLRVASRE